MDRLSALSILSIEMILSGNWILMT